MSTLEKLFVEIFERRNRILQQVKQQTDLHIQNLASKSIIEGIDPPPWLWNPSSSSSDVQKVLDKEELISEIFLPRPHPSVSFSDSRHYLCNRSVAQELGEISDGSFKVTHACSNGGTRVKQPHASCAEENNAGCGINAIPEVEISVTSPEEETEPRISDVYAKQEHSLVRIQRSKSRQKALEIRTSAKAKRKSLRQESAPGGSSPQDRSSLFGNKSVDLQNGMGNMAEPFVISRESRDADELNKSVGWKKEIAIVVPSGKSRNARNSVAETCALDGLKADCSNYKNCTQQQYITEISSCHGSGNELMEDVITFNVTTDSWVCEERAGDGGVDKGNDTNNCGGRILTSSSSQQPCSPNEIPNHNKLNHATTSKEGVVPDSVECLAQLLDDATESTLSNTLAEPELLAPEMTNLKSLLCNYGLTTLPYNSSFGPRERTFESGESFVKMNEIHSTLFEEAEMPCAGFNRANCAAVHGDELMPINSVKDLTLNCRLPSENTRLECLTKTSSGCLRSVDPKQLHFDDTVGCNFNGMSCITLQSRRLESSAKEVSDDVLDPQVFRCNHVETAQENMLLEKHKIFQESEHQVGSPGPAFEEHVKDHQKEYSVSGNQHTDVFSEEGCKFTPELRIEYPQTGEEKEESASLPHAFEKESLESNYCAGKDDLSVLGSVGFATGDDKDPGPLKSTEIQYPQKLHSVKGYSWHQNKRRKIEDHETISFSASPSFRTLREQMKEINLSMDLGGEKDNILEESVSVKYPADEQIYPKMSCQLTKTKESSVETISNEGSLYSEVLVENENITPSPSLNEEDSVLFSFKETGGHSKGCSLNKLDSAREDQKDGLEDEAFVRTEGLIDTESTVLNGYYFNADSRLSDDLAQSSAKIDLEDEAFVRTEGLIDTESTVLNGYHFNADSRLSDDLGQSSAEIDLEMIDADQTMPVLEGFIMDSETSNEKLDIPGSEIIFDKLELPRTSIERSDILEQICKSASMQTPFTQMSSSVLEGFIMDSETSNEKLYIPGSEMIFDKLEFPRTSIEHASILEQICKSASMQTPFTQMSSSFQLKGMNTCHQSLPNDFLESVDMTTFLTLDGNVYDHTRSRCVDETKGRFHAMTYPDCLPYSKSRYAWDVRNPFTFASPVGKLWDKSSLHSDSSGKRLSSNPDLRCFPIEEDPDSSEEIDDISLPDRVEENIDTGVYTCVEREPHADISAVYSNGSSSVPVAEKCASKCSSNPVVTDISVKRTSNKFKSKVGKYSKSRIDDNENDILLNGANRMNKSGYSLNNNSYSKKSSSYATGSRTQQHKLLGKETKQNNIVSNVTSFIPLVQEKQAAALCKAAGGKRDIKVKALEAAEAAKRQQEKRDQERKLRKEAMKLERARVEQENSRLLKLNKKKKDAEVVAKKRAREEEEKEKEKKRKRTEEARSQRMEERKFVGDKVTTKEQLPILDGANRKKDANNGLQKRNDISKESRDHATKQTVNGSTSDVQHASLSLDVCGTSGDSFDDIKVTPAIKKSGDVNNLVEKSYEISPYQCSDDEDNFDDDFDVAKEKYIPSWARKSCVALALPLQKDINPDDIFPPESFCSTSEIVARRK